MKSFQLLLPKRAAKSPLLALLFIFVFGFSGMQNQVQACIDPDSVITTNINYDSLVEQVEIRLSNLRLMNEQPNVFCACAVNSWSNIFTDLKYIAFVDSGTNNVHGDFAQWNLDATSSTAWNTSQPNFGTGWAGHVAQVLNMGLSSTASVELVIRAGLPPGYTVFWLDSTMYSTSIGTDEWDNVNGQLANGHQRVRGLGEGPINRAQAPKPLSYFANLDTMIASAYTRIQDQLQLQSFKIGPNPTSDELFLSFRILKEQELSFELYDLQGKHISQWDNRQLIPGDHELRFSLEELNLTPSTYLFSIKTADAVLTKKVIIQ